MLAARAYSTFPLILVTPQIGIHRPNFPKWVNMELHIVNNRETNGLLFTAESQSNFGHP